MQQYQRVQETNTLVNNITNQKTSETNIQNIYIYIYIYIYNIYMTQILINKYFIYNTVCDTK